MHIIGLTGSIAMGKSFAAKAFLQLGVPVFDADAVVHQLYAKNGKAVAPVADLFPEALKDGQIDRPALGTLVLGDPAKLKALEAIVHPLVREEKQRFLLNAHNDGHPFAVLEIPLLFETGGYKECHKVVVVSAPAFLQKIRATRRESMTEEKFRHIVKQQWPDKEKIRHADFVVRTGLHKGHTFRQVKKIVEQLKAET
jgi:dephospho-CoA kinase